jgi:hypothetical protein
MDVAEGAKSSQDDSFAVAVFAQVRRRNLARNFVGHFQLINLSHTVKLLPQVAEEPHVDLWHGEC